MHVAIIGATGLLGSGLVPEAAGRGHLVTAICRHPEQIDAIRNVRAFGCDVFDTDMLSDILFGHDAVIHSYSPRRDHLVNRTTPHIGATRSILEAMRRAGVPRLLAVGGAGTLRKPDGSRVMDDPAFPELYRESAISTAKVLETLKDEATDLQWTFLSPSVEFAEQSRNGVFRLGLDDVIEDRDGRSSISIQDYAVAMIDELEKPQHTGRRFTVGY